MFRLGHHYGIRGEEDQSARWFELAKEAGKASNLSKEDMFYRRNQSRIYN